jgi:hypothetical protein
MMNLTTARILAYTKLSGRRPLSSVSADLLCPLRRPRFGGGRPAARTQRRTLLYKIRNAVLGIVALTSMSGAVLAVPTQAAEQYIVGVHKAAPERLFAYPYGGSYLKRTRHSFGNPYVNPYYGSYYAPAGYYNYWAYYAPPYWNSTAAAPMALTAAYSGPVGSRLACHDPVQKKAPLGAGLRRHLAYSGRAPQPRLKSPK